VRYIAKERNERARSAQEEKREAGRRKRGANKSSERVVEQGQEVAVTGGYV
jgi:hypothetical protein